MVVVFNGKKLIINSKKENCFLNGSLRIKLKIVTSIFTVLISIFLFFFLIFIFIVFLSLRMILLLWELSLMKGKDWKRLETYLDVFLFDVFCFKFMGHWLEKMRCLWKENSNFLNFSYFFVWPIPEIKLGNFSVYFTYFLRFLSSSSID